MQDVCDVQEGLVQFLINHGVDLDQFVEPKFVPQLDMILHLPSPCRSFNHYPNGNRFMFDLFSNIEPGAKVGWIIWGVSCINNESVFKMLEDWWELEYAARVLSTAHANGYRIP